MNKHDLIFFITIVFICMLLYTAYRQNIIYEYALIRNNNMYIVL